MARAPAPRAKTGLASLDPADLKLTGVIWDRRGYYALVEAPNGLGYVIRLNDVIGEDARVMKITPEGMTLEMETRAELPREKGQKRLVEIRLRKEEEQ
jgi:Tfp pilus assembly protein PilP